MVDHNIRFTSPDSIPKRSKSVASSKREDSVVTNQGNVSVSSKSPTLPPEIGVAGKRPIRSTLSAPQKHHWSGRWGEEIVFHKLRAHYQQKYQPHHFCETTNGFLLESKTIEGKSITLEVIWHNKQGESGYGVDFEIIKNGARRYVEVKSTYRSSQLMLRVSRNEWTFMREQGDRYRFFCVYNAGKRKDINIIKIKNPAEKLFSGELEPQELQFKLKR